MFVVVSNTHMYVFPQQHRHPHPRPHVHVLAQPRTRACTPPSTLTLTSNIDSHLTHVSEAVLVFTSTPTLLTIPFSVFDGVPRRGLWWAARARCDLKPLSRDTRTFHSLGELLLTTALRPASCVRHHPSHSVHLFSSTTTHLRSVRARPLC